MKPKHSGVLFHILDILYNIVVIVAIVAGIRTFLISPFQVEGSSMTETLSDREYIIINKLTYFLGDPHRGDIVVFHPPNDTSKYYVKRVIGEPKDEVILRDGFVYVVPYGAKEEIQLDERIYLSDTNIGHTYSNPRNEVTTSEKRYMVPEGMYFVLGDNRLGSYDSRSFTRSTDGSEVPFVAQNEIKGRVWFVALPLSKIQGFSSPQY